MRTRLIAFVLILSAIGAADELHLRDGRVLNGRATKDEDGYTLVDRDKKFAFEKSEVKKMVEGRSLMDEYEARFADLDKDAPEALFEFGTWLVENEWPTRARVFFEETIRLDPEHRGAREALGHQLYEGAWVTPAELNRRKGLVEFEGHWYTPHELAVIKKEIESKEEYRQALEEQRAIAKRLGEILPKFVTFEKRERKAAYDELVRYAEELDSPVMRKFADDTRAYYDSRARALCRKMMSRAQVNLTETELQRPVPQIETNLGGIVRIQPLLFGRSIILVPETALVNIQLPQLDIYQTQTTADIPSGCK